MQWIIKRIYLIWLFRDCLPFGVLDASRFGKYTLLSGVATGKL